MSGAGYYDLDAILAEETLVPAVFQNGCKGLGRKLDPSCVEDDLPPNAEVELPLWLCLRLAENHGAHVRLPRFYGPKMHKKMVAGATVENLRARCAYFYDVARCLEPIAGDAGLNPWISSCFRARYKALHPIAGLLTKAHSADAGPETMALHALLSEEEREVFEAGRQSVAEFERWRCSDSSFSRMRSRKRMLGQ